MFNEVIVIASTAGGRSLPGSPAVGQAMVDSLLSIHTEETERTVRID